MDLLLDSLRGEENLHRRIASDCGSNGNKDGISHVGGKPVLTRRSLSLQSQFSAPTQGKSSTPSYFNLSLPYTASIPNTSSCSGGNSPPPPYFSPQLQDSWIDLPQPSDPIDIPDPPSLPFREKRRPMSFHGTQSKDQGIDIQSLVTSNLSIQRQLNSMREELLRTRRRCAELSEVETRKRGLELRCLGLERVVEELMVAVELLRTERIGRNKEEITISSQVASRKIDGLEDGSRCIDTVTGFGIEVDQTSFVQNSRPFSQQGSLEWTPNDIADLSFCDICISFIITSRRRFIPYQLRAIIRFLICLFRDPDFIDRILALGIILIGAVLWTSFLILQKGQKFMQRGDPKKKTCKRKATKECRASN